MLNVRYVVVKRQLAIDLSQEYSKINLDGSSTSEKKHVTRDWNISRETKAGGKCSAGGHLSWGEFLILQMTVLL